MYSTSSTSVNDAKHGFSRPEMYKQNLAGTVESYDRHVFLCYKNHKIWPARVEASKNDPLPKCIATAFKARKNDIVVKTKITVCEAREEDDFFDGDVLIFPQMIKYRYGYVTPNDVPALLDQHIVKGEIIHKLWRGQMGSPVAEFKGVESSNNGCCQGVDGGSCCRSENFEQNKVIDETTEALQKQGNKL
ncbi:hypothetical protein TSUD_114540, partial [Trifolium subterraneum]